MGRTVAVVGATGAVGQDLRRLLELRDFPCDDAVFVASERSAGTTLRFRDRQVTVRVLTDGGVFDGVDLALFSAGASVSREHAPRAVAAGATVVDNSSAWRMDPDVPLVVTEVNPHELDVAPSKGIVANPNCTTMIAMLPLKALHDAFGLVGFVATSFQAAGGAGQKGIDELASQVEPLLAHPELLRRDGAAAAKLVEPRVHAATLAFNVVPWLGVQTDDRGYTDEELKLQNESRKILGLPDLAVAPTCVRVPVMVGHAVAVRATFEDRVAASEAISSLERFPGLVLDDVATPLEWVGRDEVCVGRVRPDLFDRHSLQFFVVGDNLLKGAALNTVQIAELLVGGGFA
ncbi:MAG TPA: aspartate-semialdehyde dehydrogenase [Egibacteraceae bacterium]|nr:aspartate-semialdehyde dehydrogenase [Actinomycetota bacterium]HWB72937.1 aspartate-semialdehyde dehydrogenase [Egibacteraceae bacterium]